MIHHKYLHKYITKGSDKSQVKLDKEKTGNAATSSTPATASTATITSSVPTAGQAQQQDNSNRDKLGKSLHSTFSSVTRLAVDLPNQHRVYFNNNATVANVVAAAAAKKTTLLAFF